MAWKLNYISNSNAVYITNIAESLDKSRLFIEVVSDPMADRSDDIRSSTDKNRVYELYRYGKTATASGGSSGSVYLGTTPIYQEGAMWIED